MERNNLTERKPFRSRRAVWFVVLAAAALAALAWQSSYEARAVAQGIGNHIKRYVIQDTVETEPYRDIGYPALQPDPGPAGGRSFRVARTVRSTTQRDLPHAKEVKEIIERLNGSGKNASDEDKDSLHETLEKMLNDQFQVMHAEQSNQIELLSKRLEQLKTQHDARHKAREEIVRRRMNELLRQPDPLAWDPNLNAESRPTSPNRWWQPIGSNGPVRTPLFGSRQLPQAVPAPDPGIPSRPVLRSRGQLPGTKRQTDSEFGNARIERRIISHNGDVMENTIVRDGDEPSSTVNQTASKLERVKQGLLMAFGNSLIGEEAEELKVEKSIDEANHAIKQAHKWLDKIGSDKAGSRVREQLKLLDRILDRVQEKIEVDQDEVDILEDRVSDEKERNQSPEARNSGFSYQKDR